MSYLGQNKQKLVLSLQDNQSLIIGSLVMDGLSSGQIDLKHLYVDIVIIDTPITTQKAKIELHFENTGSSFYVSSDYFLFNNIERDGSKIRWNGLCRFDFSNTQINQKTKYFVKFCMENYTRLGENRCIGLTFDWPFAHSTNLDYDPTKRPIRIDPIIRA